MSLCERLRQEGLHSLAMADAIALVGRTAHALARRRRIAPAHGGEWSADDIEELVAEFFAKPGRIMDLVAGADTDEVLRGRVARSLKRVAVDLFRRTPLGTLHRRIDRRMKSRGDVVEVPPEHWALLAYAEEVHWDGGYEVLAAVAAAVPVAWVPDPPPESTKRAPLTDRTSLDAVCTAVLERAAAPVIQSDVRNIVAKRIVSQHHDPLDGGEDASPFDVAAPGPDRGVVAAVASVIWDDLDADERALVPYVIESARTAEDEGVLGLKRSALNARQQRLRDRLAGILEGFELGQETLQELVERASAGQSRQD